MNASLPNLQGARLCLRRPIAEGVDTLLALGRHREIVEGYGGTFDAAATFTRSDAKAAIRFIEGQDMAWVIDVGRFIGHVRVHSFAPQDKRVALAIGIEDPGCLGKGLGTEAITLALAYAFGSGLHRVSLRVLASNSRAIACYRKCGFVEEGREREAALVGDTWHDDVIMGLLDREFSRLHR